MQFYFILLLLKEIAGAREEKGIDSAHTQGKRRRTGRKRIYSTRAKEKRRAWGRIGIKGADVQRKGTFLQVFL
jgi:hypothetical protein